MTPEEFKTHGIWNFTPKEVTDTGAELKDVDVRTMQHTQHFRGAIGRRVKLAANGLTSGSHRDPLHQRGLAVDCYLNKRDGVIEPVRIFKAALEADFNTIGLYYTESTGWIGQHLALSPDLRFWWGIKWKRARTWKYYSLLALPPTFSLPTR